MFRTFFIREVVSGLKRPMLYIFFILFTLITFVGLVNEDIGFGGAVGNTLKNAPHILTFYTSQLSLFALLVVTAYFNYAALQDYQHNFSAILFSTPIHKAHYFFGRFAGAMILSIIPMLGIFVGFGMGTHMGVSSGLIAADRMGPLYAQAFMNNFFLFILPNIFISGTIVFAIASIWKNTIISFLASVFILTAYLVSNVFVRDLNTEALGGLIDILGINAYTLDAKYFTSFDKNNTILGYTGLVFWNRLLWGSIGLLLLTASYFSFSFKARKQKSIKPEKNTTTPSISSSFRCPKVETSYNFKGVWAQFISLLKINFYDLLKSNTFKIVVILGVLMLLNRLLNGLEYHGLKSHFLTYKIMDFSRPISTVLGMVMLLFFSGEVIWKERAHHINGVIDGTPHLSLIMLMAKITALIGINVLFDFFLLLVAVGFQLVQGDVTPQLDVYLLDFIFSGLPFYIIWSCILIGIQIFMNHKYLAYFISGLLLFLFEFLIVDVLDIKSYLVFLGFTPTYTYSDMNGFGSALVAKNWFNLYWMLFGVLFIILASLFWIRGNIKGIQDRWKMAKKHLNKDYLYGFSIVFLLFLLTASFIYYNTHVLNTYHSKAELQAMQLSYEKKYKKFEQLPQPKITAIDYDVSIYPDQRNVSIKAQLTLQNLENVSIDSLHYSLFHFIGFNGNTMDLKKSPWLKKIKVPKASSVYHDTELGYQIFKLNKALAPGESMQIELEADYKAAGFENTISNIRVVRNGTFFDSSDILPAFGYEVFNEISDPEERKKRNLPPAVGIRSLKDKNAKMENYVSRNLSHWVNISTLITTAKNQIAIAPGSLEKKWTEGDRSYFKYQTNHSSLNFTNFMSADYEIAHKNWNGIDIEVYYDEAHAYNVAIMLDAVENALAYYIEHFGPYYHKQARIVEIPRYYPFAQAFPGTMPYSEEAGFITNLSNSENYNIINAVVAHEIAHQYWAHQVIGANVEGATLLSESLAEYSSLMVMKHKLKDPLKMKRHLAYDFERYLRGRGAESEVEKPLYKVRNQPYIHYGKGSLVLYALQEYIGENKVNAALRDFLDAYAYAPPPYPTTMDFLAYLEPQVPEELKSMFHDWFKKVTLYDYQVTKATYEKKEGETYEIIVDVEAHKFNVDEAGVEKEVAQHDWVEIGLFKDEEEKELLWVEKVLLTEEQMQFRFQLPTLPMKASIDPKRLLIEQIIDDNSKAIVPKNVAL
ncbi:M1 family aminopeptidase [Spongiimicrobium salis]|uniref:M1 family aminopeptidase n=1 Tax=Spongiimicrobium salis TaxID=1667022 RepID=UPI00374D43A1